MVRAQRKADPRPWVGTKISATIIDFGEPLLTQLLPQASFEECEQLFGLIIAFWNAHTMARAWAQPEHLIAMRDTLTRAADEHPQALEAFELLSARRELPRFVDDPRAVGQWRIRVTANAQWNLRCDARLPPSPPTARPQ